MNLPTHSTPTDSTEAVLRALDARFAARRTDDDPPSQPSAESGPYLAAAAVLHVFDPVTLQPAWPTRSAGPTSVLRSAVPAVGWRQDGLWTLRAEVRHATLRTLGSWADMRAALDANPDRRMTGPQRLFERWLAGQPFLLHRMAYTELEELSQLYDWGLDRLGPLPPRDRVERARARRSAVAVFEHLVDANFVGRAAELRALNRHLRRGTRARPLMVWGPGGSGKTALIGKFLIDRVDNPGHGWFPFAYLPFDSESLDVREPFTLLLAIADQLAAQYPQSGLGDTVQAFHLEVEKYRDARGALQRRATDHASRADKLVDLSTADQRLYNRFADLLTEAARHASGDADPVLLVFDTFEEVVYRAGEELLGFWAMLDYLGHRLPNLRVVIAGRGGADVRWRGPQPAWQLVLGDLTDDDAVRLLTRLGVTEPGTASAVVRQIGGNPLSLRLAARVVSAEHGTREVLPGVATYAVGAELVRGQLYRRLLDHIHDPDVRALAHPGMVVRRVTVDLIRGVLAPACRLGEMDDERAHELFDGLHHEQALVGLDADGALRYREEVRRPVLDLLASDQPARVRAIHRLAVEYYARRDTPADRAEELYHRMMLGEPAESLDGRWLPGVERYLGSAVEEIPPEQRRWLAGRMSIELPDQVFEDASVAEWERLVGRRVIEAIRYLGPNGSLELLGQRAQRTPQSPLYALEARCLLDIGEPTRAAALLDRALAGYPPLGNPGRLAELLWLRALAASTDPPTGLAYLRRLVRLTERLPSALPRVQALTELVGVAATVDSDQLGTDRSALAGALDRLTESEVAGERSLVRLALCRLGGSYPLHVARLAPSVVFDLLYLAERDLLDLGEAAGTVVRTLRREVGPLTFNPGDTIEHAVDRLTRELQARAASNAADRQPVGPLALAMLALLCAENATLAGSSLAGIDEYREPWELETAREVR